MSGPNAAVRTAWHAVARSWPRDPLRPKLQFAEAITATADRALADARPLSETQLWKANEAVKSMQRLVQNNALERVSFSLSRSLGPTDDPRTVYGKLTIGPLFDSTR